MILQALQNKHKNPLVVVIFESNINLDRCSLTPERKANKKSIQLFSVKAANGEQTDLDAESFQRLQSLGATQCF